MQYRSARDSHIAQSSRALYRHGVCKAAQTISRYRNTAPARDSRSSTSAQSGSHLMTPPPPVGSRESSWIPKSVVLSRLAVRSGNVASPAAVSGGLSAGAVPGPSGPRSERTARRVRTWTPGHARSKYGHLVVCRVCESYRPYHSGYTGTGLNSTTETHLDRRDNCSDFFSLSFFGAALSTEDVIYVKMYVIAPHNMTTRRKSVIGRS